MKRLFLNAFMISVGIFLIACLMSAAKDYKNQPKKERDYQVEWCLEHNGRAEVVLKDRTRADCLTKTHAIEFDFAPKWAEAPFQALHYARLTGLKPGIVLICKSSKDRAKLKRLRDNLGFYKINIHVWSIGCK